MVLTPKKTNFDLKTPFKKTLSVLILTFLFINLTYSQWSIIARINTNQLNSVKFFDNNTGITVGEGGIWRTTDGGYNWIKLIDYSNLNCVSFFDMNTGFAVGDSGGIFSSTNRGSSWIQKTSPLSNNFTGVSFMVTETAHTGCIVGYQGKILRSTDDGNTWTIIQYPTPNYYDLYCVKMTNDAFSYAAGSYNREWFILTDDEGADWGMVIDNAGYPALRFIDEIYPFKVIAVGDFGRIRYSSNGGSMNWILPISGTTENLKCVNFTSSTILYSCGNNGTIIKSLDGGLNWSADTSNTAENLMSLSFINSYTGWCVGTNGIILHTTNGGLTSIITLKEKIPKNFKLYQNYPNPFNPTTKIKFEIPSLPLAKGVGGMDHVTLKIYDILGREVAILVNEELKPGIYEVEFDGTNYASGIYFYKLIADGKIIDTKKLLFLK